MKPKKRSKRLVYEHLLNQYRPTIRSLIIEILKTKLFNLQKGKESIVAEGATFVPQEDILKNLPLEYMALVLDGTVVEMIRINEDTASLLINKDLVVVRFDPKKEIVKKGMKYSNERFVNNNKNEKKN